MPRSVSFLSLGVGLAAGLLCTLLTLAPGAFGDLERALLTWRMERFDAHPPAPGVVIVDADEASMDAVGQWPWPRRTHARLIDRLREWGARAVVFDMVFADPSTEDDDAALEAAIRRAGNVVLASYPSGRAAVRGQEEQSDWVLPLARFGADHGSAGIPLDPDKHVRHLPPPTWDGEPTLTWRALEHVAPSRAAEHGLGPDALLHMAGPPGTYPTVSYASVLEGILDPRVDKAFHPQKGVESYADLFNGATVLVGCSAPIMHDVFPAPFARGDRLMPGVELHANALGTLLEGHARHDAPLPVNVALTLLLPMAGALAMARGDLRAGSLAGAGVAALGLGGNLVAFADGWALWLAPPLVAQAVTSALVLGAKLARTERDKQRLRSTFSRYVAPGVVETILKHPERYALSRSERRSVTVLFADVQGFTSLSEQLPAEQVEHLLNGYLSAMTRAIFAQRGAVDKYIGDGIMAVWGNLGDQAPEEAALGACRAALEMQQASERLSEEWVRAGLPPLIVRIGLHSGEALVGNFGSEQKLDFTVIGDVVNTASRLEALNKPLDTRILISGATYALVSNRVEAHAKGEQAIRGKTESLGVLELVGLAHAIPASPSLERNPA